jgi:hypothetical protein
MRVIASRFLRIEVPGSGAALWVFVALRFCSSTGFGFCVAWLSGSCAVFDLRRLMRFGSIQSALSVRQGATPTPHATAQQGDASDCLHLHSFLAPVSALPAAGKLGRSPTRGSGVCSGRITKNALSI